MRAADRTHLVLVPGLLCDKDVWHHQVAALTEIADCTIADVGTHDSVEDIARSVLTNAPHRFALAGISMGGYIALEMIRQAPERVTRLALLDTQPHRDTLEQSNRRQEFIETAQQGGFDRVVDGFPPLLFHPSRLADESMVGAFTAMAHRVGCGTFLRQQTAIITRPDSVPTLKDIACPTLVICGKDDLITPPDNSELMASLIPEARLVLIDQCGHMSTVEVPELINGLLKDWLAGLSPSMTQSE